MITDPIFYLAAVPAVILLGLAKGGFAGIGTLAMPLMALVIPPVRGASIILPVLIVQDLFSLWAYRGIYDRRNLLILLPGACVGIALGYVFAAYVKDAAIALLVGLIAAGFGLQRLIKHRIEVAAPAAGHPALGVFWGGVAGFVSMIANAGAPPFHVFVVPQQLPRDSFVGTSIVFFAVLNWIKLPAFFALGLFTRENLATSAALFPLAIVSTWAGVWLVRRVSTERFYRIIYIILVLVGVKLCWDGLTGLR